MADEGYGKFWIVISIIVITILSYFFFRWNNWDIKVFFYIIGGLILILLVSLAVYYYNLSEKHKNESKKSDLMSIKEFTDAIKQMPFFKSMPLIEPFEVHKINLLQNDGKATEIYYTIVKNSTTKARYYCAIDRSDINNTDYGFWSGNLKELHEKLQLLNKKPEKPKQIIREFDTYSGIAKTTFEGLENPNQKKDADVMEG